MKRWENPDLGSLKVCCTKTKAIGPCGAEVNIEGEGNNSGKLNVKCMDWTRGHQKFDDGVFMQRINGEIDGRPIIMEMHIAADIKLQNHNSF